MTFTLGVAFYVLAASIPAPIAGPTNVETGRFTAEDPVGGGEAWPRESSPNWLVVGHGGYGAALMGEDAHSGAVGSMSYLRPVGPKAEAGAEVFGSFGSVPDRRDTFRNSLGSLVDESFQDNRVAGVMLRWNYFQGDDGVRPYFTVGGGIAWMRSEQLHRSVWIDEDGRRRVSDHSWDQNGTGLVSAFGMGVEVPLGRSWAIRPQVDLLSSIGGLSLYFQPRITAGIAYVHEPASPPSDARTSNSVDQRPRAGSRRLQPEIDGGIRTAERDNGVPPDRGTPADERVPSVDPRAWASLDDEPSWDRVLAIPLGKGLRVTVSRGGRVRDPDGRLRLLMKRLELEGRLVESRLDGLRMRLEEDEKRGSWIIPREHVDLVVAGRLVRDPPWEGALIGLGAGMGVAIAMAVPTEDLSNAAIPVFGLLIGGPLAVAGGLADHYHLSFVPEATVYRSPTFASEAGRFP